MVRLIVLGLLFCALRGKVYADPYWVAWEENDFPENEGWLREGVGDRSVRTLAGGVMTMDSLANKNGQDFYSIYSATDPGPGEEFVVEWRLRVNDVVWDNPNFRYDPGWAINSADGWYVSFVLGVNELHSLQEQVDVEFESGLFHEWEFRSTNMRTFTISLDRSPVWSGAFVPGLPYSKLSWGDTVWGPTSHVEWDYFHVGVVPEPTSCLSMLALLCAARAHHLIRTIPCIQLRRAV
ncbi:MAG: hypothetical protein IT450_12470 [Phycisphaerales bacterium]|nr:hypothetical protein [Phycisphaerales bacterium]